MLFESSARQVIRARSGDGQQLLMGARAAATQVSSALSPLLPSADCVMNTLVSRAGRESRPCLLRLDGRSVFAAILDRAAGKREQTPRRSLHPRQLTTGARPPLMRLPQRSYPSALTPPGEASASRTSGRCCQLDEPVGGDRARRRRAVHADSLDGVQTVLIATREEGPR